MKMNILTIASNTILKKGNLFSFFCSEKIMRTWAGSIINSHLKQTSTLQLNAWRNLLISHSVYVISGMDAAVSFVCVLIGR